MPPPNQKPASLTRTISLFKTVASFVSRSADSSPRSLFPFIPRPLRLFLFLLLLVNVRSLPLAWHFRVFRPVLSARLHWLWLNLTLAPRTRKQRWLDTLSAVAHSPFSARATYRTWASPDECDYNMHLSNSSYAKILDMARCKYTVEYFSPVFREGVWFGVGATHIRFLKEIPIGVNYEVRVAIAAWDEKWVYILSHFVTKSAKSTAKQTPKASLRDAHLLPTPSNSALASGTCTPLISDTTNVLSQAKIPAYVDTATHADGSAAREETLHAVCINEVVCKHGRRTVPPALALAACGYGMEREAWERRRVPLYARGADDHGADRDSSRGGGDRRRRHDAPSASGPSSSNGIDKHATSLSTAQEDPPVPSVPSLLRGAWKDVREDARWWDHVLLPYEDERARRLAIVRDMRLKLESVVRIVP